jgi:uncharacterized membrane protein
MHDDRPFWRSGSVLLGLVALVGIVVTDALLRHMGGKAADFTLFIGRFHPLLVHLPIGFVLLVATAEAATLFPRFRARVDPAVGLALPLLVLATAAAFLLGHLLARSGDFAPGALNVHRRFELFATVGICLCPLAWEFQSHAASERARWCYRGLLGIALGVLSIGAHFGGTLTRGDTYLTRYAPEPLKKLLGGAPSVAASASASAKVPAREPRLFGDVIQPILSARCVSCHGEEKVKGGLRLDSLAALTKGGEDGNVVTPGNPSDSPLLARVLLPADDDDHMPPEGKPGLTPAEIAVVRFWIERGANDSVLVRDALAPQDARGLLEHAVSGAPDVKTPTAIAHPGDSAARPAPAVAASSPSAAPTPEHRGTATPRTPAPATSAGEPAPAPSSHPPSPASSPVASSTSPTAILADKCVKCHGPTKQKNKLRVDSWAALLQGGKSGPAIVPGDSGASLLVQRINLGLDDDKHMPPAREAQLTPTEVRALGAWIAQGSSPHAPKAPNAETHGSRAENASADNPSEPKSTASGDSASHGAPVGTPAHSEPPSPALLATLPSRLALYPTEIAPLLHERCAKCHAGKNPAGGLTVDDYSALRSGGDTGPAITPGKPEASLLVHRINLPPDDEEHMPPTKERQLSPDEIALVTAWVTEDGSATNETALAALPGAAVAAIATQPPARAESDVSRARPEPRGGGCGACAVSERVTPSGAVLGAAAVALGLSLRRRGRRSLERFRYR